MKIYVRIENFVNFRTSERGSESDRERKGRKET